MLQATQEELFKRYFSHFSGKNIKITPTAIAEELSVNAASMVDMIKKLTEKELIICQVNGAKLTDRGNGP